jgi:outer membrane protein
VDIKAVRKKRGGRLCLLGFFIVMSALVASAAEVKTTAARRVLTLNDAIEMALKNQPNIEAQVGQVLLGEAKAGQARSNYYPHLTLGSAYTNIWPVGAQTSSKTSLAGLPPGGNIPTGLTTAAESYNQYAATANLSQILLDFGKTGAQVGAQDLNVRAARLDLQNIQDQVIFAVKQAYYSLLAAERNRDVAAEAVSQFQKHLEYARALFEVGSKPKFDVTKAEVDLSNGQVNLIKAENVLRLARASLSSAIGLPSDRSYAVEDDLSAKRTEWAFEKALEIALQRRPDLLSLQKQKESARESFRAAQKSHLPTISGVASATYVGTNFPLDSGYTAGVNLVFPLFTGFTASYQVAEAQANLTIASAKERTHRYTITLDLEQGYLALREAEERKRSSETAIKQGKENLELATERYAAGLAIGVEVTDAVVNYANAQATYITAYYDEKIAQARVDKALGGQLPQKSATDKLSAE